MSQLASDTDRHIMTLLLEKAEAQKGKTNPNPVTAAVIVKNGQIISEGIHSKAGGKHAEVLAIEHAGPEAKNGTLYVNLEPCTHWGQTPPCVEAIIQAGITKVVFSIEDPNPKVQQHPAKHRLEDAGIDVISGILAEESLYQNEVFFKSQICSEPFITLKAGMSLDGKIALCTGESKYITSEESRKIVHKQRAQADAIIIGASTILTDNPSLDIRFNQLTPEITQPKIIIIDPKGQIQTTDLKIFQRHEKETIIILTANHITLPTHMNTSAIFHTLSVNDDQHFSWDSIKAFCAEQMLWNILLEGGAGIFSSALSDQAIDKVCVFMAPKIFGGKKDISLFRSHSSQSLLTVTQIKRMTATMVSNDLMITGYIRDPKEWWVF